MAILNLHVEVTDNSARTVAILLNTFSAICAPAVRIARRIAAVSPNPEEVQRVERHREDIRTRADRLMSLGS